MEAIKKTFAQCKEENRVCIPLVPEAMWLYQGIADLQYSLPL